MTRYSPTGGTGQYDRLGTLTMENVAHQVGGRRPPHPAATCSCAPSASSSASSPMPPTSCTDTAARTGVFLPPRHGKAQRGLPGEVVDRGERSEMLLPFVVLRRVPARGEPADRTRQLREHRREHDVDGRLRSATRRVAWIAD